MKTHILIIEDDVKIQGYMASIMQLHQYKYDLSSSGKEGLQLFYANNPDLVLLDLGLPDMNGIDVIKKIRAVSSHPIIIISARNEVTDKIEALDAGADDYISKPFHQDELIARIRVCERRLQSLHTDQEIFCNGNLVIDTQKGIVYVKGNELHVTPTEYKLLVLLSNNIDKVLTYNKIIHEVWGVYANNVAALRVFVTTLRKKIEAYDTTQYIQTHVGVGYRMIRVLRDS